MRNDAQWELGRVFAVTTPPGRDNRRPAMNLKLGLTGWYPVRAADWGVGPLQPSVAVAQAVLLMTESRVHVRVDWPARSFVPARLLMQRGAFFSAASTINQSTQIESAKVSGHNRILKPALESSCAESIDSC
jgi:hypothetical protein